MGLEVANGYFDIPEGTFGNYDITTLTFRPKVVMFWGCSALLGVLANNFSWGFGVAVDGGNQWCQAAFGTFNIFPKAAGCSINNTACWTAASNTFGVGATLTFVSSLVNGFRINKPDVMLAPLNRIYYLALGGSDLTNVAAGVFQSPVATGAQTQAITGLGFQPKLLSLTGTYNTGAISDSSAGSNFCTGWDNGVSRWAGSFRETSGFGANDTASLHTATSSYVLCDTVSATPVTAQAAKVNSFDADGFTLGWTTQLITQRWIGYLALGGTFHQAIGTVLNMPTAVSPLVVSGAGFRPTCGLFSGTGNGKALDTWNYGANPNNRVNLGIATSPADQLMEYPWQLGSLGSYDQRIMYAPYIFNAMSSTLTAVAAGALTSFDADGFSATVIGGDLGTTNVHYLLLNGSSVLSTRYSKLHRPLNLGVNRGLN